MLCTKYQENMKKKNNNECTDPKPELNKKNAIIIESNGNNTMSRVVELLK